MIALGVLVYLSVGMFWAGVSGSGSVLDAALTAVLWPTIPAYLLGTRLNLFLSSKARPRRRS